MTGRDPEPDPGPPKPGKIPAGPREEPAPGTGPDWLRVLLGSPQRFTAWPAAER